MKAVENLGGKSHEDEMILSKYFQEDHYSFEKQLWVLSVNLGAAPLVQGWS